MGTNEIAFSHNRPFRSSLHLFFQRYLFTIYDISHEVMDAGTILARPDVHTIDFY